jgi:uncharacterized damage-inducible protein DinB
MAAEINPVHTGQTAVRVKLFRRGGSNPSLTARAMRNGDIVYMRLTKLEILRHAFCQMVHHRAQLGVYLRLLNITIPGVYGPSADDMEAMS